MSRLSIKVIPKSGRSELKFESGILKVWLKSAPEDGKANQELVLILAKNLAVTRASIEIVGGLGSRNKVVNIQGISQEKLTALGQSRLGSKGDSVKRA